MIFLFLCPYFGGGSVCEDGVYLSLMSVKLETLNVFFDFLKDVPILQQKQNIRFQCKCEIDSTSHTGLMTV